MKSLSRPLSDTEISYLHLLLCNARESIARNLTIKFIEARLSQIGGVKLSVLRYLLILHQQISSQKDRYHTPTLLAQAESKIIFILGFSKQKNSIQESSPTIRVLIGEMLVTLGLISEEQLSQAIAEQKISNRKLGEILINKRWLSFEQLDRILTVQVDIQIDQVAEEQKLGFILMSQNKPVEL